MLNDMQSSNEVAQAQRVVIKCKKGMDQDQCLQAVLESNVDHQAIQLIHKLKLDNSIVAMVHPSHLNELKVFGFEIRKDTIRRPLHIPESLRFQRRLSNNNGPAAPGAQQGGQGGPAGQGGPGGQGGQEGPGGKNKDTQQTPYGIDMVRAMQAWTQFNVRGKGVKVCMIDSGINSTHEDFAQYQLSGSSSSSFITPWSVDSNFHGTHTSGTVNAKNNTIGVVGVAPQADLYIVRVFDSSGNFYGSDIIAAAEACATAGSKVISMSLGGPSYDAGEDATFQQLYSQGILSVAAGGNDGTTAYSYPAAYDVVVGVSAVDSSQNHPSWSNSNDKVDFAAPGKLDVSVGCISIH